MEVANINIQFKHYRPGSGPCNALLKGLVKTQPWPGHQPSVERQEHLVCLSLVNLVMLSSAREWELGWDELYIFTPSSRCLFTLQMPW